MIKYLYNYFKDLSNFIKSSSSDWKDGYAPSNIPRSYITEGMRVCDKDPNKVIPIWKFNSNYYNNLT